MKRYVCLTLVFVLLAALLCGCETPDDIPTSYGFTIGFDGEASDTEHLRDFTVEVGREYKLSTSPRVSPGGAHAFNADKVALDYDETVFDITLKDYDPEESTDLGHYQPDYIVVAKKPVEMASIIISAPDYDCYEVVIITAK